MLLSVPLASVQANFWVTWSAIEDLKSTLDQIKAICNLQPPRNPKEVQKLTRMTAALNRFISRFTDRCRPFFQLLHKWNGFEWIEECALTFQQLKDYFSWPPIMSRLEEEEVLFDYIVMAPYAVSLVLVRVENGVQWPVYYVSKSLHEVEVRYLQRKLFWLWCMLHENYPIIFKLIEL